MTATEEEILALIAAGKVSPTEGEALLNSLKTGTSFKWKHLLNPVEHFSLWATLAACVFTALLALPLGTFGVRFDGALDAHRVAATISLPQAAFDQSVNWLVPSLLLWLATRLFSRGRRIVDFIIAVGVARIPLVLIGFAAAFIDPRPASELGLRVALIVAVVLPLLGLFFTLLYRGFRHASGLKGARLFWSFLLALMASELITKGVLLYLSDSRIF